MNFPIVKQIPYQSPVEIFSLFHHQSGSIFLDSSSEHTELSRYSYIAIHPFEIIQSKNNQTNPFDELQKKLIEFQLDTVESLPPFQGGLAGYFGYELLQHLEQIPLAKSDDMSFDDMILGLYDTVFAFDHLEKKAFIFSSGFPETNHDKRKIRAEQRLDELLLQLNHRAVAECFMPLTKDDFHSSFTQDSYCQAVEQVIDYILAGDIFEANISQRFSTNIPKHYSAFELYKRLRVLNPASFSAYLNFSPIKLVSASPERFLKVVKSKVETRPIKGTRPRGDTAARDKALADELTHSVKDHAENVMIVDLMRNDLSKVCEPHSVKVTQLCGLESFASVHHLVSVISATLKPKLSAIDLLKATFPGGSITGAPKIRSMEIISEIEPTHRGPYCGCIGYLSWAGDMDTSITIRTIAINNDALSFQVGGAIVADSNPAEEFAETLTKGQSLLKALTENA